MGDNNRESFKSRLGFILVSAGCAIGIAAMEIFGSYISKEYTLTGEAVRICALDTFVAFISGIIIFYCMLFLWGGA